MYMRIMQEHRVSRQFCLIYHENQVSNKSLTRYHVLQKESTIIDCFTLLEYTKLFINTDKTV